MSRPPTLLIVPDGMADWPQEEFNGKTPWEAAETPNLDSFCRQGRTVCLQNIPAESPADSGVANMALLGYDPREYYLGRGALEAFNLGIDLVEGEIAYRCNLIFVDEQGRLADYSAGNLAGDLGKQLFADLEEELGNDDFSFYPGLGYRGLLVTDALDLLDCARPHDQMGSPVEKLWPRGPGSQLLKQLMIKSRDILEEHPLNQQRRQAGLKPANMIWPWGGGCYQPLPAIQQRYNLNGSVVAGVDLINGLGRAVGMQKLTVPGATGGYDTDMLGKARAAIKALEPDSLVFLHLEAPDEAGHDGNAQLKLEMIEKFDRDIVGPVYRQWQREFFNLALGPDHYTPIQERTHVKEPVPFLIVDGEVNSLEFTEKAAKNAPFVSRGWEKLAAWYCEGGKFNL